MNRADAVRSQLERILADPLFSGADRRASLLRFLVEESLKGQGASLKEALLAVEVFGRTGDHDPKVDSLVRVEMGRLRSRLIEYYAQQGSADPVRIQIPKGRYEPVFTFSEPQSFSAPENSAILPSAPARTPPPRTAIFTAAALTLALLIALFVVWKHKTPD
ncbi:MAG TPA: hypothetical protein VKT49_17775, partial [Bryobacteraceae bacterium]|nr:hypothetical protein [Bryobacteraceae bacterium]